MIPEKQIQAIEQHHPFDDSFSVLSVTVNPKNIGFLKFILEGYDGMSIVTTIEPKLGKVIIRHPVSFTAELQQILADLCL